MIEIDGGSLTLEQTAAVADGAEVSLASGARSRIARARSFVEEIVARGEVVYGINTGFGALADVRSHMKNCASFKSISSVRTRAASVSRFRKERCEE